jgi:hypothetical protein
MVVSPLSPYRCLFMLFPSTTQEKREKRKDGKAASGSVDRSNLAAFQWLDAVGNRVSTDLAPETTLNSTITVRDSSALDFNAPFFRPGKVEFRSSPSPLQLDRLFRTSYHDSVTEREFVLPLDLDARMRVWHRVGKRDA